MVRVINRDYICAKLNSVQQSVNIKAFWSQDTHPIIQANIITFLRLKKALFV